ncbi:MAG: hypothetical protein RLZZ488_2688 [Pseudomonadota bacterium]
MSTKKKFLYLLLSGVGLAQTALLLPSCSDSNFTSDRTAKPAPADGGNKSPLENGNNSKPGGGNLTDPGFAEEGRTLDLYVVMDKSGSLYVDPATQRMNSGSDPTCKRFDALLALVDSLRGKLKSNEQVRMTLVTFSKSAKSLGTMDGVLAQSREQISRKFRAGVCDNPDYDTTNYERGISTALQEYAANLSTGKLDLESVVFFSDGAAKDRDAGLLEQSIRRLNTAFPSRIYGVLLGQTSDRCVLKDSSGRALQTSECMLKVVGSIPEKLLSVDDANGLAAAWSDLVNK